ncbi:MLP-like protein 328 [Syzygium oleosum]|uniref:MLP-like protein 328 n=1 Tax=Syzygium oleosum TaxID=219896 RepID=UPI0024BB0496|nr:MLP-like protein 328 [Syzygium oleosum]
MPHRKKSKELKFMRAGDWVSPGSVKLWNYTIDGVQEIFKEKMEIDEDKKSMTMVAVGGHILEQYKVYKAVYQVFPKGESGSVKISFIYKKFKETDGEPHNYLLLVVDVIKDLDKHLTPKQG